MHLFGLDFSEKISGWALLVSLGSTSSLMEEDPVIKAINIIVNTVKYFIVISPLM